MIVCDPAVRGAVLNLVTRFGAAQLMTTRQSTMTEAVDTLAFSSAQSIVTERSGFTVAYEIETPYAEIPPTTATGAARAASSTRVGSSRLFITLLPSERAQATAHYR